MLPKRHSSAPGQIVFVDMCFVHSVRIAIALELNGHDRFKTSIFLYLEHSNYAFPIAKQHPTLLVRHEHRTVLEQWAMPGTALAQPASIDGLKTSRYRMLPA